MVRTRHPESRSTAYVHASPETRPKNSARPPQWARTLGLLAFLAIGPAAVFGCAAHEPNADTGTDELKAFLEGATPTPRVEAEVIALRESFGRQAVRAQGYRKSGVGDAEEDGWSPVVEREGDAIAPADVSPWVDAGDIDESGRFEPLASLCPEMGPFTAEDLPEEEQRLAGLQDRLARLSCALQRLTGREVAIAWSKPSAAAVTVSEDGASVEANPRVLHILPTGDAPAPLPHGAIASGGGPFPGPAPDGVTGDPGTDTGRSGEVDNHPRPGPEPGPDDGGGSSGSSSSGCSGGGSGSGCSNGGGGSGCSGGGGGCSGCGGGDTCKTSSCRYAQGRRMTGDINALIISMLFVSASVLRRRRTKRTVGLLALTFCLLFSARASAQPTQPAQPAQPAQTQDWRKLRQEGLKHYQEKHYDQAIASLKAAHELNPSADTLEKIAASQKALNKTPQAIATLETLLAQFGPTMSADKQRQVKADIERMRAQLVYVRVTVTPKEAALFVDGDPLPAGAAASPVPLAPGQHTLSARLEGYAQAVQAVDMPAGSKENAISLTLTPDKAFLSVTGSHPEDRIAIDSTVVAKGSWAGLVAPGKHLVQVYRPGGPSYSFRIDAVAGQAITLPPRAARPAPPPPRPAPTDAEGRPLMPAVEEPSPLPPPPPPIRGPYAEGVLSLIWQTDIPYGFEHNGAPVPGFALGGRFGYRVTKTLGIEGLLEYARISNDGTVTQIHTTDKNGDGTLSAGENFFHEGDALYNLQSIRFGPGLRLMSGGLKNRVFGTFGFGGLYEFIDLDHVNLQWVETAKTYVSEGTFHHDYNGWSPYMLAELGYEHSAGDLLIGGAMSLTIESVSGIEGEPYDEPVQARLGFSLRVGYSAWSRAEEAR